MNWGLNKKTLPHWQWSSAIILTIALGGMQVGRLLQSAPGTQAMADLEAHPLAAVFGTLTPSLVLFPFTLWMFGRMYRRSLAKMERKAAGGSEQVQPGPEAEASDGTPETQAARTRPVAKAAEDSWIAKGFKLGIGFWFAGVAIVVTVMVIAGALGTSPVAITEGDAPAELDNRDWREQLAASDAAMAESRRNLEALNAQSGGR